MISTLADKLIALHIINSTLGLIRLSFWIQIIRFDVPINKQREATPLEQRDRRAANLYTCDELQGSSVGKHGIQQLLLLLMFLYLVLLVYSRLNSSKP